MSDRPPKQPGRRAYRFVRAEDYDALLAANERLTQELEHARDRAVCSGCGSDVSEGSGCLAECGAGEMIPASDLPAALRSMRDERDEAVEENKRTVDDGIGIGYTIATGRLFSDFAMFHAAAEQLLGRPIFTHELADEATYVALREAVEARSLSGDAATEEQT